MAVTQDQEAIPGIHHGALWLGRGKRDERLIFDELEWEVKSESKKQEDSLTRFCVGHRGKARELRAKGCVAQHLASVIGWVSYDAAPKGQLFLAGSGRQLEFSGKQPDDVQIANERGKQTGAWAQSLRLSKGNQEGVRTTWAKDTEPRAGEDRATMRIGDKL